MIETKVIRFCFLLFLFEVVLLGIAFFYWLPSLFDSETITFPQTKIYLFSFLINILAFIPLILIFVALSKKRETYLPRPSPITSPPQSFGSQILASPFALLSAKDKLIHSLITSAPIVLFAIDANGVFTLSEGKGLDALGVEPGKGVGKSSQELFQQFPEILKEINRALKGETFTSIVSIKENFFEIQFSPLKDDQHQFTGVLGVGLDITVIKRAEKALQYRVDFEKRITTISTNLINLTFEKIDSEISHALQSVSEFMEVDRSYIFSFREKDHTISNTHEWCATGIQPQITRLKDLPLSAFPWFEEKMKKIEIFHVPSVEDLPAEAENEKKEFQLENIQSLICIPLILNKKFIGFLGFDSVRKKRTWSEEDITLLKILGEIFSNALDRKEADERLKQSLKEKEVLIKEVHHRVKNNLQIISSLLSLQSDNIQKGGGLDWLKESQNRIKSMALIHERLYQSEDFAQIDFGAYVKKLVSNLCYSYKFRTETLVAQIRIDENVLLNMNVAIPCGLIINELVSNSLKYAFPADQGGKIQITLQSNQPEEFVLVVKDNGVGLPETFDITQTETLGLQLVYMLVKQLNGMISLETEGGTQFTITFYSTILSTGQKRDK